MSILEDIKQQYAKSYHYFEIFYNENHTGSISLDTFENLNFNFQLGVFISFFNSVSTDVDIYSNESDALAESIKEAFATYEEYLFLDS